MKSVSTILSILLILIITISFTGVFIYFLYSFKQGNIFISDGICYFISKNYISIKLSANYNGNDVRKEDLNIFIRDKISGNNFNPLAYEIFKGYDCNKFSVGFDSCNVTSDIITSGEKDVFIGVKGNKPSVFSLTCFSSLIIDMPFDEGSGNIAYDYSGNNNNGNIYNAIWTTGITNKALLFNGRDSYVYVPTLEPLSTYPAKSISFSVWIYSYGTPQGNFQYDWQKIQQVFEGHTSTWEIFAEGIIPGYFLFLITDGSGNRRITSTTLEANKWYFIVGTYDGYSQKLYVNGELKSELDWQGDFQITSGAITIGKDFEGNIQYFNGIIDNFKLFSTALNSFEINFLYNSKI